MQTPRKISEIEINPEDIKMWLSSSTLKLQTSNRIFSSSKLTLLTSFEHLCVEIIPSNAQKHFQDETEPFSRQNLAFKFETEASDAKKNFSRVRNRPFWRHWNICMAKVSLPMPWKFFKIRLNPSEIKIWLSGSKLKLQKSIKKLLDFEIDPPHGKGASLCLKNPFRHHGTFSRSA